MRTLYYGSLAIDIKKYVKMTAVVRLMDDLIMCCPGSMKTEIIYSDGTDMIKGHGAIRSLAFKDDDDDEEELPF